MAQKGQEFGVCGHVKAFIDTHDTCLSCCKCSALSPCPVSSLWTSETWSRLARRRTYKSRRKTPSESSRSSCTASPSPSRPREDPPRENFLPLTADLSDGQALTVPTVSGQRSLVTAASQQAVTEEISILDDRFPMESAQRSLTAETPQRSAVTLTADSPERSPVNQRSSDRSAVIDRSPDRSTVIDHSGDRSTVTDRSCDRSAVTDRQRDRSTVNDRSRSEFQRSSDHSTVNDRSRMEFERSKAHLEPFPNHPSAQHSPGFSQGPPQGTVTLPGVCTDLERHGTSPMANLGRVFPRILRVILRTVIQDGKPHARGHPP